MQTFSPRRNEELRKDGEYPLFDGLGNERMITDSTQATTGTIIQEGFGNTFATTGSSTNPFKWHATSGYRDDGDFGLMEVGARYYDPQVGRFITRDTELDQHPYAYCEHDAINFVDPSGHLPWYERLIDWIGDKGGGVIERLPGGTGGVWLRGISIFGPIWIGGIVAAVKLKHHWKKAVPKGSIGYENGGTRASQRRMIEKWSDPDAR